ncbi:hypothetical protein [Mucilaginibacter polytrichastri]|uniref:Uncharacterized protein n=1 Tax=Mucilaginibacter polytrichastri TaxID=1302689 RepID=A0A1Q6A1Y0_9SPHI|nr:hypothetical protein [Mucilaginibacter polytrichastri]OKS88024.1 hypothetical protein RG47T_3488 [Mucilaginibacter polytrichastri]SFT10435.1 hypothetical protein SAMN04487890_110217 [Mucilaginibacter polytrichastri]
MKTITVDILQDEALNLLKDLEALNVIRLHNEDEEIRPKENLSKKYKGAMSKQSREEIEKQLHDLSNEWN